MSQSAIRRHPDQNATYRAQEDTTGGIVVTWYSGPCRSGYGRLRRSEGGALLWPRTRGGLHYGLLALGDCLLAFAGSGTAVLLTQGCRPR
jgi:hypothetical protein